MCKLSFTMRKTRTFRRHCGSSGSSGLVYCSKLATRRRYRPDVMGVAFTIRAYRVFRLMVSRFRGFILTVGPVHASLNSCLHIQVSSFIQLKSHNLEIFSHLSRGTVRKPANIQICAVGSSNIFMATFILLIIFHAIASLFNL